MNHTSKCTLVRAIILCISLLTFFSSDSTAQHSKDGFKKIFNGKNLKGWQGDTGYWRVENKTIVGEVTAEKPLKTNTFLIWQGGQPGDFELKAEVRITINGNSGIQYRSELVPDIPFALKGYQSDVDGKNQYSGINYEERGRGFLANRGEITVVDAGQPYRVTGSLGSSDSLKTFIRDQDWNELHIIARGNRLQHYINGVLMSDVTDNDPDKRKSTGLIGLQAHVGPPMKVEYRNIRIKE